jgi:hypothetical protein
MKYLLKKPAAQHTMEMQGREEAQLLPIHDLDTR